MSKDWKSDAFRSSIVKRFEAAIRQSKGNFSEKRAASGEKKIFELVSSREEYLTTVARILQHVKKAGAAEQQEAMGEDSVLATLADGVDQLEEAAPAAAVNNERAAAEPAADAAPLNEEAADDVASAVANSAATSNPSEVVNDAETAAGYRAVADDSGNTVDPAPPEPGVDIEDPLGDPVARDPSEADDDDDDDVDQEPAVNDDGLEVSPQPGPSRAIHIRDLWQMGQEQVFLSKFADDTKLKPSGWKGKGPAAGRVGSSHRFEAFQRRLLLQRIRRGDEERDLFNRETISGVLHIHCYICDLTIFGLRSLRGHVQRNHHTERLAQSEWKLVDKEPRIAADTNRDAENTAKTTGGNLWGPTVVIESDDDDDAGDDDTGGHGGGGGGDGDDDGDDDDDMDIEVVSEQINVQIIQENLLLERAKRRREDLMKQRKQRREKAAADSAERTLFRVYSDDSDIETVPVTTLHLDKEERQADAETGRAEKTSPEIKYEPYSSSSSSSSNGSYHTTSPQPGSSRAVSGRSERSAASLSLRPIASVLQQETPDEVQNRNDVTDMLDWHQPEPAAAAPTLMVEANRNSSNVPATNSTSLDHNYSGNSGRPGVVRVLEEQPGPLRLLGAPDRSTTDSTRKTVRFRLGIGESSSSQANADVSYSNTRVSRWLSNSERARREQGLAYLRYRTQISRANQAEEEEEEESELRSSPAPSPRQHLRILDPRSLEPAPSSQPSVIIHSPARPAHSPGSPAIHAGGIQYSNASPTPPAPAHPRYNPSAPRCSPLGAPPYNPSAPTYSPTIPGEPPTSPFARRTASFQSMRIKRSFSPLDTLDDALAASRSRTNEEDQPPSRKKQRNQQCTAASELIADRNTNGEASDTTAAAEPPANSDASAATAAANRNNAAASRDAAEPLPGCSHWTEDAVAANAAAAAAAAATAAERTKSVIDSRSSSAPSPQNTAAASVAAPVINWEGMYNELYGRHAALISRLQSAVECPICFEVPRTAPVPCCKNGHVICQPCLEKGNIYSCPSCKVSMMPHQRCVANVANTLLDIIPHSCTYKDSGCTHESQPPDIQQHEASCSFRNVKCPSHSCKALVCLKRLKQHLGVGHGSMQETHEVPQVFLRILPPDLPKPTSYEPIRFTFDERIFYLQTIASTDCRYLYNFVQMEGTKMECCAYTAQLTLTADSTPIESCQTVQITPLDLHCLDDFPKIGFMMIITEMVWSEYVTYDEQQNRSHFSVGVKMTKLDAQVRDRLMAQAARESRPAPAQASNTSQDEGQEVLMNSIREHVQRTNNFTSNARLRLNQETRIKLLQRLMRKMRMGPMVRGFLAIEGTFYKDSNGRQLYVERLSERVREMQDAANTDTDARQPRPAFSDGPAAVVGRNNTDEMRPPLRPSSMNLFARASGGHQEMRAAMGIASSSSRWVPLTTSTTRSVARLSGRDNEALQEPRDHEDDPPWYWM